MTAAPAAYEESGARLSGCGQFRWDLRRRWAPDGPLALWVMLNPSTADALRDDQTIRKCRRFSERLGMAGLAVVNLTAVRTPRPADLLNRRAAILQSREQNEATIREWLSRPEVGIVIPAWGAWAGRLNLIWPCEVRALAIIEESCRATATLGFTAEGCPRHPSRLAYDTQLVGWHRGDR